MRLLTRRFTAALLAGAALAPGQVAEACTTFVMHEKQELVVGKSFDFFAPNGRVMTNQRGVTKYALLMGPGNAARWVSRYGSITFNQVGKEYPLGGMNEAGLVVETMSVEVAQYPVSDDRAALSELQWIQYQLDNCASVREVIATDTAIRIERPGQPLHFLVADRQGNVAAIEFLAGKLVCHTGESLTVPVLTNDTYEASLAFLCQHAGFGGSAAIVRGSSSLDRFATAASLLAGPDALRDSKSEHPAFAVLDAVTVPRGTVWNIVYDLHRGRIHFRTAADRSIRRVDLGDFDFDCGRPARMLDLATHIEGAAAAHFADYRTEMNRELVEDTFQRYRAAQFLEVPAAAQEVLARYPESLTCATAAR